MDMAAPAQLEEFRAEVRDWLAANLTDELREVDRKSTSAFIDKPFNLAWQKILYSKGWVAPYWPKEYGGLGWNEEQRYIFECECASAGAPSLSPMGLKMVAPSIMKFGTDEQKTHYLPRLLAGVDYWCQGYSEPQAGSDLASLALRADKVGSDYVLNGSKIWTTHAHCANRMFCLARTSRDGRPQEGITFLLLEMATPGISVRPIVSLSGDHDFNQVFFDNVCVPQSGRLGEENQGWAVAKYLLEFERSAAYAAGLKSSLEQVRKIALATDDGPGRKLMDRPAVRRKFAMLAAQLDAIYAVERSVMGKISKGENPGPVSSMLKVQGTEAQQQIQEFAIELAGPYSSPFQIEARQPCSSVDFAGPENLLAVTARYFNGRAASIYGGSNEIQRGIMAKMVLGI
ncbi:MAG: acyl-CoA dehydrogenase family protein [Sphingorhabdus sp.]